MHPWGYPVTETRGYLNPNNLETGGRNHVGLRGPRALPRLGSCSCLVASPRAAQTRHPHHGRDVWGTLVRGSSAREGSACDTAL